MNGIPNTWPVAFVPTAWKKPVTFALTSGLERACEPHALCACIKAYCKRGAELHVAAWRVAHGGFCFRQR